MGYLTQTQQRYYSSNRKSFTGDGATKIFTIANNEDAFPSNYDSSNVKIYIDDVLQLAVDASGNVVYKFTWDTTSGWNITFSTPPSDGATIEVDVDNNFGNYQYLSLNDIIDNFTATYIGEGKILQNVLKADVSFHAHRALAELSYDTLKSCKSQEIEIPASLTMILPHDYVNYVKLAWKDGSGIERIIYPVSKTSNPTAIKQDSDGNYSFDIDDDTTVDIGNRDDTDKLINQNNSDTWNSYKSASPSKNQNDYQDDTYWPAGGERYGLDPQYAQANGSYFIDCLKGIIHFSSNLSGKTIILHYLSDNLGTNDEMVVPKLAEEAIYKWIAYGCASARMDVPEQIIQRLKREKFTETRKAKIRLSNIKIEEISQIMRGKSKWIKH